MRQVNKQKGFTIIELVVVILLLGILTATALPRFMDVTDEAHAAVVDGLVGGLATGSAMFRAQWYAEGQPNTVVEFANMKALRSTGYPLGIVTGNSVMATSDDCKEIYENLLQPGRPSIGVKAAAAAALSTIVTAATTDVVAYLNTTSSVTKRSCAFAYTGQYKVATATSPGTVPVINYNAITGEVALGTALSP